MAVIPGTQKLIAAGNFNETSVRIFSADGVLLETLQPFLGNISGGLYVG